mmetsp:Transcript_25875/g.29457  ORF Transcript_25875/g.29457 Transcript_25875/m.29457 type:complete len:137 (+) Transcript_25875:105-515(+)
MPTEHTQLKNAIQAGDSNSTDKPVVIGKGNTYQRLILIVTGSFLALLVWIAVADKSGGKPLASSAYEIAEGAVALADYQVDSANLALTKDIFGVGTVSENEKGCSDFKFCSDGPCCIPCPCICTMPPVYDCLFEKQ